MGGDTIRVRARVRVRVRCIGKTVCQSAVVAESDRCDAAT